MLSGFFFLIPFYSFRALAPTFPFLGFYSWDVTARHRQRARKEKRNVEERARKEKGRMLIALATAPNASLIPFSLSLTASRSGAAVGKL